MFSLDLGPRTAGGAKFYLCTQKRYHGIDIGLSFGISSLLLSDRRVTWRGKGFSNYCLPDPFPRPSTRIRLALYWIRYVVLPISHQKSSAFKRKQYWMDSGMLSSPQRRSHHAARVIPTRKGRKIFHTSFGYFMAGSINDSNRQGDRIYRNR
jgi:hypothetical protein